MKKYIFAILLLLVNASEAVITRLGAAFGALAAGGATSAGVYWLNKPEAYESEKESKEQQALNLKWSAGVGSAVGLTSLALLYRRAPGVVFKNVQKAVASIDSNAATKIILSESDFGEVLKGVDRYFVHSQTPRIEFFKTLSSNMAELQRAQKEVESLRGHISEQELNKSKQDISALQNQITSTIVELRNTPDWMQRVQAANSEKTKEAAERAAESADWAAIAATMSAFGSWTNRK